MSGRTPYSEGVRFVSAVFAAVLLAGCTGAASPPEPSNVIEPSGPFSVEEIRLEGPDGQSIPLKVWVADAPEERALGLMHRTELPDGAGMLFAFDQDTSNPFWMKNTLIPLSIGFFSSDGELVHVLDMQPCRVQDCPLYQPEVVYRTALEVPLGWFERAGIAAGQGWRFRR